MKGLKIMFNLIADFFKNLFVLVGMVGTKISFPPPLSREEETEMIMRMKEGDPTAREKLIEHNLRLVAHIARKYAAKGRDTDDLIAIGTIGLVKAIGTFSDEKGRTVAAYAARCIENAILS
ncbi:MAG: sigma-70 family RNA polymerase sigma factor [Christensenellaceae bacterium]|nr:sigma-70 family RNA polymerase sigma factor [Christensenellaceae bacterium]